MTKVESLWFVEKHHAQLRSETLPNLENGDCRIQAICSSVSPGTERLVLCGGIPRELHQQMRCPHMGGSFDFPVKYGYSLVGKVTEGPSTLVGKVVHVLHPHQEICQVAAQDVFTVPPGVTSSRASLASNMETAVTAIWDGSVEVGDRVLVVGFGIIGSLVARVASLIAGVDVDVYEVCEQKKALARAMGFEVVEELQTYDVAFHCSASQSGLQTAIESVGFEGTIVELSWYGVRNISINLGTTFHSMRKQIICSQVSNIPSRKKNRWDYQRRKQIVFALLKNAIFDSHITHEVSFKDLANTFNKNDFINSGLAFLVNYNKGE